MQGRRGAIARACAHGSRDPSRRAPRSRAAVGADVVRHVKDLARHAGLERQRDTLAPVHVGAERGRRPRRRRAVDAHLLLREPVQVGDGLRRRLQGKQASPSVSQSVSQHDLVSKLSLVACSLCGSCDRSTYWPPHVVLTGPLTQYSPPPHVRHPGEHGGASLFVASGDYRFVRSG